MARLFRNVPILNYLEMSPFLLYVPCTAHFRGLLSLECVLERALFFRAKRKDVFQTTGDAMPPFVRQGFMFL